MSASSGTNVALATALIRGGAGGGAGAADVGAGGSKGGKGALDDGGAPIARTEVRFCKDDVRRLSGDAVVAVTQAPDCESSDAGEAGVRSEGRLGAGGEGGTADTRLGAGGGGGILRGKDKFNARAGDVGTSGGDNVRVDVRSSGDAPASGGGGGGGGGGAKGGGSVNA